MLVVLLIIVTEEHFVFMASKSFLDSKQAFNCLVIITYLLSNQAKAKRKAEHLLLPVSLVLKASLQYTKAGRQAKC